MQLGLKGQNGEHRPRECHLTKDSTLVHQSRKEKDGRQGFLVSEGAEQRGWFERRRQGAKKKNLAKRIGKDKVEKRKFPKEFLNFSILLFLIKFVFLLSMDTINSSCVINLVMLIG